MFLAKNFLSGPSGQLRREELAQQVQQAIAQLTENDREMLLLRHVEELTNRESAQLLHIEPAAARKRYGRALLRFRNKLVALGVSPEE
jgi:RNA polymerase sigma-70 factor (ECF subfamily)